VSINSEELELERIKVLVVDDHTLFSEGTVSLLRVEPRILVVGIAKNGIECMSFINKTRVDVVLLDINLPDICGIDMIDEIKMVQPGVKILMLTGQDPKGYVTKSVRKGANGFLLKNCLAEEMIEAILIVYNGGSVYYHKKSEYFTKSENFNFKLTGNSEVLRELLTYKENEIMELVSKGLRNKEIAAALGIKVRTVEFHVSNILFKLGVSKRFEAILQWVNVDKQILY